MRPEQSASPTADVVSDIGAEARIRVRGSSAGATRWTVKQR
ncbi:hypothetical protein ACFPM0_19125 [Pseudonocardia sulfidoxydans]